MINPSILEDWTSNRGETYTQQDIVCWLGYWTLRKWVDMGSSEPTRIMVAVSESTIKGYPHASISSRGAFDWTIEKIVRSNTSGFKLLIIHVQVPDEDGSLSLSLSLKLRICIFACLYLFCTCWLGIVKLECLCVLNCWDIELFVLKWTCRSCWSK